jgi:hypothetical protein
MIGSRTALATLAVVAATVLCAAPASARQADHFRVVDDVSFDDCGFTIDGHQDFMATEVLRRSTPDGVVLGQLAFRIRNVYTNPETGASFSQSADGIARDVSAVNLGGEVFQYTSVQNGSVFTIRDGSGRVVSRDTGLIQFVVVVDESTGDLLSQELGTVNGPHAGFATGFCGFADDLIG